MQTPGALLCRVCRLLCLRSQSTASLLLQQKLVVFIVMCPRLLAWAGGHGTINAAAELAKRIRHCSCTVWELNTHAWEGAGY